MPSYPRLGFREDEGLPVLLVDKTGKILPFLNAADSEDASVLSPEMSPREKTFRVFIPLSETHIPGRFFPEQGERFSIGTDDEVAFGARLVESLDGARGLAFLSVFSMSEYFRGRLGVGQDKPVAETTLLKYGTFGFLLFRLEEYVYFLDFSPDTALQPEFRSVVLETRHSGSAWRRAREEAWQRSIPLYPDTLDVAQKPPAAQKIVTVRRKGHSVAESRYLVSIEGTWGK